MILPLALGAAALYGLYRYDQSKKMTAALAPQAAPPASDGGTPAGYAYPQATSTANPNLPSTQSQIVRFQAAQPVPTGKFYHPADGDLTAIVALRFDPETDNNGKLIPGIAPGRFLAELGKLNGFLTSGDFNTWVKGKKAIHLPAYATDKGARQYATGAIASS